MPSIAYIAGQFPLRSETFVWREVRELRRRGWTVHTFALYPPDENTPADLLDLRESTTIVYGGGRWQRWRNLVGRPLAMARGAFDAAGDQGPLALKQRAKLIVQAGVGAALGDELRRRGVRHVHAHFAHAPTSIAMYAVRSAGLTFSFTGHANDLFQRRQLLPRKLARAAFVACISQWHRELYRSLTPRDDNAYPIIRCGIDTDAFAPRPSPPIQPTTLRVLTVCRLVEKKGVDVLIRAVAKARGGGTNVTLTICGDGPLRGELESLARQLMGVDRRPATDGGPPDAPSSATCDCVTFAGAVDNARVREALDSADVFALPCRVDSGGDQDGIPVAIMEAMACGLPVISGDLPAIRELVQHGRTGLIVDGRDVIAVAAALKRICDDVSLRGRLATAGRQQIIDHFSLAASVSLLEQKFTDVIARSA